MSLIMLPGPIIVYAKLDRHVVVEALRPPGNCIAVKLKDGGTATVYKQHVLAVLDDDAL